MDEKWFWFVNFKIWKFIDFSQSFELQYHKLPLIMDNTKYLHIICFKILNFKMKGENT